MVPILVVLILAAAFVLACVFYDYVWAPRMLRVVRVGASLRDVERALGPPDSHEVVLRAGREVDLLQFSRGIFRGTYVECVVRDGVVGECSTHHEDLFQRIDE